MLPPLERIEVYIDDEPRPLKIATASPFRLQLDTTQLADGEHLLRVVVFFREGRRAERRWPIVVDNLPLAIEGLEENAMVEGKLDREVRLGSGEPPRARRPRVWLYAAAFGIAMLGLWSLNALRSRMAASEAGATPAQAAPTAPPTTAAAAPPPEVMNKGKQLYASNCASCHQASGQGVEGSFPPLAGNPDLSDATRVIDAVIHGRSGPLTVKGKQYNGQMPAVAQLSNEDVAAVASYVRNSFGNSFGPVTADEDKARR